MARIDSTSLAALAAALFLQLPPARAQAPPPEGARVAPKLPVREIAAFKDGHAYVMREGDLPTDGSGNVAWDEVPGSVIGTFWPFSAPAGPKLAGASVERRRVRTERAAVDVRQLVEANVGADVMILERDQPRYAAKILAAPERPGDDADGDHPTDPASSTARATIKGAFALVETADGVKSVSYDRIINVTFKKPPVRTVVETDVRRTTTWRLDWGGAAPAKSARVGWASLERGFRWTPEYRVEIDGAGRAKVSLQAVVVNDLADLEDVTLHMVVGAPKFEFADRPDPMTLADAWERRAAEAGYANRALFNNNFASNAIGGQTVGYDPGEARDAAADTPFGGEKTEDLFLFTAKGVTLRKGARMTLAVAEYSLPYEDVYVVDVGLVPPAELAQASGAATGDASRRDEDPKVSHVIRISNEGPHPLTTSPALVLRNGRVVGQSMLRYAPRFAKTDVALAAAVDVRVRREDRRLDVVPNARTFGRGNVYNRVNVEGTLLVVNMGSAPIALEATRDTPGDVDLVEPEGDSRQLGEFDAASALGFGRSGAYYHAWPSWWSSVNSVGRVTWKLKVEPGKPATLKCRWHYFWN